jgi:hypothetical protein
MNLKCKIQCRIYSSVTVQSLRDAERLRQTENNERNEKDSSLEDKVEDQHECDGRDKNAEIQRFLMLMQIYVE